MGTGRHVIKGLLSSGNEYEVAIKCLHDQYEKPHLLHRIHVRTIMCVPILKDGSGKELCPLHDNLNQHLQALRAMKYEPSGPFVTAVIEEQLGQLTMFEWQRHSQEIPDVPHYKDS